MCVARYLDVCPNSFWRIILRMRPSWRESWNWSEVFRMPMISVLPDDSESIAVKL